MIQHDQLSDVSLRSKIRQKEVCFGGNRKLKIYGTISCSSGKRMNRENRVFFCSEEEATKNGFRPCGHCMKEKYQKWKRTRVQL